MSAPLLAYTGHVSAGSKLAPLLNQHNIGEMTNRGQTPARTPFALDNGAYIDWRSERAFDADKFLNTLKACFSLKPDFVIIPDKVAEGLESLRFSLAWLPELRKITKGQVMLALAVQDGMEPEDLEPYLGEFDVLFIGGSRPWKYRTGEAWCRWARRYGLPVHIGAIGSMVGVRWAKAIGATSVDSTSPLWSKPAMTNWLKALEEPSSSHPKVVTPRIMPNQKRPPKFTRRKDSSRDGIGSSVSAYTAFHERMMGNVMLAELNQIRREFGDAHLRNKISDEEFLALESTASAIYPLLRLENASLPPFTERTLQTQENIDRWTEQLSETDDYHAFKHAYADLERAYRNKHISAFDTITLQTMCQALFNRFYKKKHPGSFGLIIDPKSVVAGKAKGKKLSRVGAMLPITDTLVTIWKAGEDIDWGKNKQGLGGYGEVLAEVKKAAGDPESPTEFLEWLYHQNRNARIQFPNTAVYDIPPYDSEILQNPNVSADFALWLAAQAGYGVYPKPSTIFDLFRNPAFPVFCLEHPDYMSKVFGVICKVHKLEIPAMMQHLLEIPEFSNWLGPQVAHYTFKAAHQSKAGFSPHYPPESVIIYKNGVVDVNYRTIKENKNNDRLFPSLAAYLKKYVGNMPEQTFIARSDQSNPKLPRKKSTKPSVAGLPSLSHSVAMVSVKGKSASQKRERRGSRIGAISPCTQTLISLWKEGRNFGPYDVIPELGDKQPRQLDAEFREAASSPEVPSQFLLWVLEATDYWTRKEVLKNPNLSLEDAFTAIDERNLKNHWKRASRTNWGNYTTLPEGVLLLDNPAFQLFLLEDPAVYERLFDAVKFIGRVSSKEVYRDQVNALLSHPVMQDWLGSSTTYTFKKVKRATVYDEPDRTLFPLAVTLYQNGVVRVEHTISERRDRTPLFRTLEEYLDNPSFSKKLTAKQFLAKSDQLSAKRKGK